MSVTKFNDTARLPILSRYPSGLTYLILSTVVFGLVGPNFALWFLAVSVLAFGSYLLWRPGEPPILLFVFVLGWLSASASIMHSNILGIPVNEYTWVTDQMETAIFLSLGGITFLAIGMRIGAGSWVPSLSQLCLNVAMRRPLKIWFRVYIAAVVVSTLSYSLIVFLPGLSQLILGFSMIKWAAFFLLAYASFVQKRWDLKYFLLAFIFEFIQGAGGFFSEFKTVFYVTFIAIAASRARFSTSTWILSGIALIILVIFGSVWTAIKQPYRAYVSSGTSAQVVLVSPQERFSKLVDLIIDLEAKSLYEGFDQLIRRISYVEYFGATVNFVPAYVPHENGSIYADAFSRPFMPRILFPDKLPINDTERTNRYTGGLAGSSENTSISLGYVAEAYIDFGSIAMMICLFLVGLLYGLLYRMMTTSLFGSPLLGMSLITTMLIAVGPLENSFTKIFGSVVSTLIASIFIARFLLPRLLPWLQQKS